MVHRSLQWNRLAMIEVLTCQGSRQSLAPEQVASELAVPLRLGQSVYNFFRGNVTRESPQLGQMGSEQLCLSWNDYEGNFSVAFRDLRQELGIAKFWRLRFGWQCFVAPPLVI